jgi:hypothetical protein
VKITRTTYCILGVLLLLLTSCSKEQALTGPIDDAPVAAGIAGRVMDASTGLPIAGAIVSTVPPTQSLTTDTMGFYRLSDVDTGRYTVTATRFGYVKGSVDVQVVAGKETVADIALLPGANQAPEVPHSPVPQDGATLPVVNADVELRWQCSDPEGDAITYDVYYGRELPLTDVISSDRETPEFGLPPLETGRHYWRIAARDARGNITEGPVWSFVVGNEPAEAFNALDFDGNDDYALVDNTSSMNLNGGSFTVEAWIRADTLKSGSDRWGCIVTRATSNDNADFLLLVEDHHVVFQSRNLNNLLYSAWEIESHRWYHVAGVQDAATGTMRLYINGEGAGQTTLKGGTVGTGASVFIGARDYFGTGNPAHVFDGNIHEVRIWNRARTQSEIAQTMHSRLMLPQNGLVGYWRMNEGKGGTIGDGSGNNRTGNLRNDPQWVLTDLPIQ